MSSKASMSMAGCSGEHVRQTVEFSPSVWGDFFISCVPKNQNNRRSLMEQKVAGLCQEVRTTLARAENRTEELRLINELQRLGIQYHFEHEINETLRRIHSDERADADDMRTSALRFRLLRQHGHNVSSDFLNKFKDGEGKFKQELSCNSEGLLCLYEASWLSAREEETMDEALDFARRNLDTVAAACVVDCSLSARIRHALEMPFHRGMRRLETRRYISIYEDDETRNHVLLELAKLDFGLQQSLYQAEIKSVSVWWKELDLVTNLSFARDRVVECYFWSLGVHFEPQYSQGRMILTKLIQLASVMDDMFDAYGTIDELQLFADVIQRWEVEDVGHLPKYMQVYLDSLMSFINGINEELERKGRLLYQPYLIESIKALVRAYFHEAKWANSGYMPSLEEYLDISVMSSGYPMLSCASFILMGEDVSEDALDWVASVPKIVEASALIARLMDDLVSTELEQERKHVTSAVQCYMNDKGVGEKEASAELSVMIKNAWKDINSECLKSVCPSEKHLNMLALNLARMMEVIYKYEDSYTNPSGQMKENISMLLVRPVQD